MLAGKEIEVKSFNYESSDPLEHNIHFESKAEMIQALKNIGIELIYGSDLSRPIGYKANSEEFEINNPEEFERFFTTVSFKEWNA
jgi:uncharacterized protein related to proFAR isomerase